MSVIALLCLLQVRAEPSRWIVLCGRIRSGAPSEVKVTYITQPVLPTVMVLELNSSKSRSSQNDFHVTDRISHCLYTNSACLFVCFWRDSPPPPSGPGPPHSRGFYITHKDTPQSVGLLWTSDQPLADTST
jgi:hypothetical protein